MQTSYFYAVATKELIAEGAFVASDSHAGLERKLSSAIDGKVQAGADMGQGDQSKERANSNYPVHYVQAVHDKHVIYSNGGKTFAHKYEKDGEGDPQLKGNPQEVEHSFTPIKKTNESFAESMQFELSGGTTNYSLLCESFGDKGEINFTVIKPGWSKNNRYYPADLLKSRANIFEGAKMFVNHATDKESASRPEGDLNNWVANITKVWAEGDGTVKATAKIIDPAFKAKLSLLGESKMLNTMGVSIRAMGESKTGEAEGRKGAVVESLLAARSVDFVTFAGAGGEVESLN